MSTQSFKEQLMQFTSEIMPDLNSRGGSSALIERILNGTTTDSDLAARQRLNQIHQALCGPSWYFKDSGSLYFHSVAT